MLFGLAIEKSNIKADLLQIELPGSDMDFVRTQIRTRATICLTQIGKGGGDMCNIPNCLSYYLRRGKCSENYY